MNITRIAFLVGVLVVAGCDMDPNPPAITQAIAAIADGGTSGLPDCVVPPGALSVTSVECPAFPLCRSCTQERPDTRVGLPMDGCWLTFTTVPAICVGSCDECY